ncbi:MAG: TOBE domain-containing protein, partial [Casimicrobiaceae bacterium]
GFPNSRFVADFIGQCNLYSGSIVARSGTIATLDVTGLGPVRIATTSQPAVGSTATLALRPEQIRIASSAHDGTAGNHYRGRVADLLYMGDVTVYKVETPGGARIEALLANSQGGRAKFFEVGDPVEMSWPVDAGHFISE